MDKGHKTVTSHVYSGYLTREKVVLIPSDHQGIVKW